MFGIMEIKYHLNDLIFIYMRSATSSWNATAQTNNRPNRIWQAGNNGSLCGLKNTRLTAQNTVRNTLYNMEVRLPRLGLAFL